MPRRIGGTIYLKIDGIQYLAKGNFTYNLGAEKREPVLGEDGVHGYKTTQQVARIEGEITDTSDLDLEKLVNMEGGTAVLELANGKTVSLPDAWYAGDGDAQTQEGNVQCLIHADSGTEV